MPAVSATARAIATLHERRVAGAAERGRIHTLTLPVMPSACCPWLYANVTEGWEAFHNPVAEVTTFCFAHKREASAFKLMFY